MAKSVYLSPSMQENNRGAGNFGTEEYRMNQIADVVQRILSAAGVVVYRNKPEWTLEQMVNDSNAKNPNIHFAIHSNAGGGRGCEVFCYSAGTESERLAKAVYAEVEPLTPTTDRGVKIGSHLYEIRKTVATAALIEIAFHDNADDAAFIINSIENIGTAIARGILKYFGLAMPVPAAPSAPAQSTSETLYRVRKSWEDAGSQVGAYKVLENAKAECDKYPGYGVFDEKGNKVYPLPSPTPEKPKEEELPQGTLIMGKAEATAAQMVSFALKGNSKPSLPSCTLEELAKIFLEEAEVEGVRVDIAWAQSLKETGYFKYGGIVLPEQNNYAGIGALNGNAKGEAAVFESPRMGARAQVQHLKAYASTEALKNGCVDPRFNLVKRGSAKYVEWLGASDNPNGTGWAWPGKGYGGDILKILEGILKEPKEAPKDDTVPQWQRDAFNKLVEKNIIKTPEAWADRLSDKITIGEVMGVIANMI